MAPPFLVMKPIKPNYVRSIQFECLRCGRLQDVEVHESMNIKIGMIIQPYSGGGIWGVCRFCKAKGLRALEEIEQPKKRPVGWRLPK